MNAATWIYRSLAFHRRHHMALAAGTALSGAILTAALLAGQALNTNLRHLALERIGRIRSAVELRGRYVDAALADRLSRHTGATVAPVLRLSSSVLTLRNDTLETRFDRVLTYGVDPHFFALGATDYPPHTPPAGGEVLFSSRLADAVATPGHAANLSLRFEQPAATPLDMPLGNRRGEQVFRRPVQPAGCLPDPQLGRFSLIANPLPPLNAYVNREWLAREAGLAGRVNLLVSEAPPAALEAALRAVLTPSDIGVRVTASSNGVWNIQSDRLYLDEALVQSLSRLPVPPVLALHHLVDTFAAGEGGDPARELPYGFISALTPSADSRLGVVPADMADDEIVINAWLADRLKLALGDRITLRWRRFEAGGRLVPDSATFRIARVIDMAAAQAERAHLPAFPGLTDVNRCADWNIGLPMDHEKLTGTDTERYWNAYGATPQAFVTFARGRTMLGTLFGSAMGARLPPETDPASILSALVRTDPGALGMTVRPVREEAMKAVEQATDFRELFLGMSCLLMASALILTGLLASLGVAQRREEAGILRSLGFQSRPLAGIWMLESLPAVALGACAGVVSGLLGARLLMWALNRFWSHAIVSTPIPFAILPETCLLAGLLTLALTLLAVYQGIRHTLSQAPAALLGEPDGEAHMPAGRRWAAWNAVLGILASAGACALLASCRYGDRDVSQIFFGSGLLFMAALLCGAPLLIHLRHTPAHPALSPARAGLLNVVRYRKRSLLVMILLATGSFLTVGILSMKQDPADHAEASWSGSGGFGAMVETSLPAPGNEIPTTVRRELGSHARILAFRVHEGDEAGCLNLNRAIQPRLLGVDPDQAAALRAFDRAQEGTLTPPSVWSVLKAHLDDGTVPVLAGDLTTVEYGLKAKTGLKDGSVIDYTGEDGRIWHLRVADALPVRSGVLQGSLIIDRTTLDRMFPSATEHGLCLVRHELSDTETAERLRRALGRYGVIITPTRQRLQALGAVESTYLDMFLVLGGLGMILGAAGTGLVVLRNAAVRRRELAILRAVGLPPGQILVYLAAEYLYLVIGGLASGIIPALIAVHPAILRLGQAVPVGLMAALITTLFAAGLLGTLAAVSAASRMRLIEALRGE